MTNTTIHQVQGDKAVEVLHQLASYAFRSSPPLFDREKRAELVEQRKGVIYFALYENGTPVACAASTPMSQQVRGTTYGMGGLFDVATHPGARRKGYARRVLTRLFAAIREDGRPLLSLYPFRELFYERMGYVTFPQYRKVTIDPTALRPVLDMELGGEVELMPIGDGYDEYLDYVRKYQQRVHGMAVFDHKDIGLVKHNSYWLALAKVAGEVVGLMMYDLRGETVAEFKLRARCFYYNTSQGRYLLLAWIARHIDQANQVEINLPPFEHPETWLANLEVTPGSIYRAPMARVLDVGQIDGMQIGSGSFSAHITDAMCEWNEGRFQFESVDGTLAVTPTDKAECDLGIQAISALVYGTHDPADFAIRDWGNPSREVQATMREMFPPLLPYLHEHF